MELLNQVNMENCCIEDVSETIQKMVRVFQLFERDQIKVYNFTTTQCYCLLELSKTEGLTMNELSSKMNLDSSTMTRIVDKLVRDKYIFRKRLNSDKRVVKVQLTSKGFESAQNLSKSLNEYYEKIIVNLPVGRVQEVLDASALLLIAFEKANPNCC